MRSKGFYVMGPTLNRLLSCKKMGQQVVRGNIREWMALSTGPMETRKLLAIIASSLQWDGNSLLGNVVYTNMIPTFLLFTLFGVNEIRLT